MDVWGVGFESREKILCVSLYHAVCFWRLLWDRVHPTKCAGWWHDALIFFIYTNEETQRFLHFDTPSRVNYFHKVLWDSKKLDFSESRRWLWEARKKFLCVVRSYCLLSETCLGPYASNKVRGVITWRTNHFLLTQTWELIDFCILMIAESCFWRGKMWWNLMKSVILMVFLNFSGR